MIPQNGFWRNRLPGTEGGNAANTPPAYGRDCIVEYGMIQPPPTYGWVENDHGWGGGLFQAPYPPTYWNPGWTKQNTFTWTNQSTVTIPAGGSILRDDWPYAGSYSPPYGYNDALLVFHAIGQSNMTFSLPAADWVSMPASGSVFGYSAWYWSPFHLGIDNDATQRPVVTGSTIGQAASDPNTYNKVSYCFADLWRNADTSNPFGSGTGVQAQNATGSDTTIYAPNVDIGDGGSVFYFCVGALGTVRTQEDVNRFAFHWDSHNGGTVGERPYLVASDYQNSSGWWAIFRMDCRVGGTTSGVYFTTAKTTQFRSCVAYPIHRAP